MGDGLKETSFIKHLFKITCTVDTFSPSFYLLQDILDDSNSRSDYVDFHRVTPVMNLALCVFLNTQLSLNSETFVGSKGTFLDLKAPLILSVALFLSYVKCNHILLTDHWSVMHTRYVGNLLTPW